MQKNEQTEQLSRAIAEADAVVIGAGAGLSTSAGLTYGGERFARYFGDFAEAHGIRDIYSGGFYPFETLEEQWAWWSRHIYINRYVKPEKPVYERLYEIVDGRGDGAGAAAPARDYFVLTTNVDHQFQKAGFEKERLFYTQGDYGLWQCSRPCHKRTYDNKSKVVKMIIAQGFSIDADGSLTPPVRTDGSVDFDRITRAVPSDLVPYCPVCGEPMSMNLRADQTFVEDEGWHAASERYAAFLREHRDGRILFLEMGVGANTPGIIKYPFWQMTAEWDAAAYVCLNAEHAYVPGEIGEKSLCIVGDIGDILQSLS